MKKLSIALLLMVSASAFAGYFTKYYSYPRIYTKSSEIQKIRNNWGPYFKTIQDEINSYNLVRKKGKIKTIVKLEMSAYFSDTGSVMDGTGDACRIRVYVNDIKSDDLYIVVSGDFLGSKTTFENAKDCFTKFGLTLDPSKTILPTK